MTTTAPFETSWGIVHDAGRSQGPDFDTHALHRGIELGDVETLMGLYHADATIEIVDQTAPPSTPNVLSGTAAIRAFYDDISCRDMEHRLATVIVDDAGAAFLERCQYPGGPGVVVASTIELLDGRIARQVMVQSWDA
ncbi:MAG: nuclear transport factor 2 family protein [Miltoncostaeaceae bacterium]